MSNVEPDYTDAGFWLAQSALTAVEQGIAAASLDAPILSYTINGTGVPLQDLSDGGMLWTRVATVYPTDGSGQPFTAIRAAFDVPAWAWLIEIGLLFPRANLDEDGYAIDASIENAIASRDGDYRMAILDGASNYLPDVIRPIALGQRISPWTPIGPDGAKTGGILILTVVTSALCVSAGL